MKHTISCLVRNEPGVLAHVARRFGDEHINIYSLAAGTTEDDAISRMTIVVDGDDATVAHVEQIIQGLPNVLEVQDLAGEQFFARELLLVKVAVVPASIGRLMQMAEMFDARVIGVSARTMTLELAADEQRINAMLRLLEPMEIISVARSGRIAVAAGDRG
ncbi:MAG: acetolactate synthase small subunit [Candidatus Brocadiaceae bacterium]|nr:acetolactate synthase small subunit [Candidatus Brocadiaceae bacterium]